jgi:hypothetical protein
MSEANVHLVFSDRADLKKFLSTINAARIRTSDGRYLQWQTVEASPEALELYQFEVLPDSQPQFYYPPVDSPLDSELTG